MQPKFGILNSHWTRLPDECERPKGDPLVLSIHLHDLRGKGIHGMSLLALSHEGHGLP